MAGGRVFVARDGAIATVTLSSPGRMNALDKAMYTAMTQALARAESDPAVRVVLLHGQPGFFTAGADIHDFLERAHDATDTPPSRFLETIVHAKKPIVAGVSGLAVGIGTTMLLHCDFVYAAPSARFQLPFVPLGIVPEFGSTYLLPLLAGYQRAAELLLLGQPFTAEKAVQAGIVTALIPEPDLISHAETVVKSLANLPPESLRLTKRLLKAAHAKIVRETIDEEGRIFRERLASPEAKEAISAFLEKRKPDFSRF